MSKSIDQLPKAVIAATVPDLSGEAPLVVQDLVVEPPSSVPSKIEEQVEFNQLEKIPSDWAIKGHEEGIEARHRVTGKLFVGSMGNFNELLK